MENKPRTFSEYVGVAEVACWIGYHPVYVRRLCRTGKIPATKVFSHWRIRRTDLEALIQGRQRP